MKTAQNRVLALSDIFRAIAGDEAAQYDLIACNVYSAAYSIMLAGNKTQFDKLEADAKAYGTDSKEAASAVKELLGAKSLTAPVKRFRKVYAAVLETFAQLPRPELIKDVPQGKANADKQFAILDPLAQDYAEQFTSTFTMLMSTPEKTEAEQQAASEARAENKAKREKEKAKAAKAEQQAMRDAMRSEFSAVQLSADDIGMATVDALKAGALSADVVQMLRIALSMADSAAGIVDVDMREVSDTPALA